MRTRREIENTIRSGEHRLQDDALLRILEVLLDIREVLVNPSVAGRIEERSAPGGGPK